MKVSRDWLQTFFDTSLPDAAALADALTFHSSEIEEVFDVEDDAVLDVKVLPDKSAWLLSHRGVAKELSVILELPMANDPLADAPLLEPRTERVSVVLDTSKCARYVAAHVTGVMVGPSPAWLVRRLEAIGQRSINNVVDATNYVMFHLGQPLHAFDAGKLQKENGAYRIGVRAAREGEEITTLTNDAYTLTTDDLVITDATNDMPIGIAGVKGGNAAAVDAGTTELIIESANFDRVSVRKTAQRHKLRTDASARYENGVVPTLAGYGLVEVVRLIEEIAEGTHAGWVDEFPAPQEVHPVSVSIEKVNSVLGLSLSEAEVLAIFARFGYEVLAADGIVTVTPPFERDDLRIPEDLIEEIGRIHGLAHVVAVTPDPLPLAEVNARFVYAEQVRDALLALGFSEVYTSSFNAHDMVQLENALASDKGFLRSTLRTHLTDALARNVHNKDLLGLSQVALFEIGTVFDAEGEHMALSFGVRTGAAYKPKADDPLMQEATVALTAILGIEEYHLKEGVAEIDLDAAIADLPPPFAYASFVREPDATYAPFSQYPFISRDIALWVSDARGALDIEAVIVAEAEPLLVRATLFDEFEKDGRSSYAFRLVFQSMERTLSDGEVNEVMAKVAEKAAEQGWEVR